MKKNTGFTLAETLITLAIIGVVAALTIPSVVQKYEESVTQNRLKTTYSTIYNAYNLLIAEKGTLDTWGLNLSTANTDNPDIIETEESSTSRKLLMNNIAKYLNHTKIDQENYMLYLNNGVIISSFFVDKFGTGNGGASCETQYGTTKDLKQGCASIYVDVNGSKEPNKMGKDIFLFYLTKYTVIPAGTRYDTVRPFDTYCANITNSQDRYSGYGCSAWVIENGNMDYLHCTDLSWDGKHKCSD